MINLKMFFKKQHSLPNLQSVPERTRKHRPGCHGFVPAAPAGSARSTGATRNGYQTAAARSETVPGENFSAITSTTHPASSSRTAQERPQTPAPMTVQRMNCAPTAPRAHQCGPASAGASRTCLRACRPPEVDWRCRVQRVLASRLP